MLIYCAFLLLFFPALKTSESDSIFAPKTVDSDSCPSDSCPHFAENSVPKSTEMAGKRERTFLAVKPDGVQRGLVGQVLKRFEKRGYKLVGVKMLRADEKLLTEHYKEHVGKKFFNGLLSYMNSGPVVAMVFEGTSVVSAARKMLGETKPLESAPGTLRGDFCIDMGRNLVHASDSLEASKREIQLWFKDHELLDWQQTSSAWIFE